MVATHQALQTCSILLLLFPADMLFPTSTSELTAADGCFPLRVQIHMLPNQPVVVCMWILFVSDGFTRRLLTAISHACACMTGLFELPSISRAIRAGHKRLGFCRALPNGTRRNLFADQLNDRAQGFILIYDRPLSAIGCVHPVSAQSRAIFNRLYKRNSNLESRTR